MNKMNLKKLYQSFMISENASEAFIANIVYERYGRRRKKMLQGLYNIINGSPTCYWGKCVAQFTDFSLEEILVSPSDQNIRPKYVNIHNLEYYA